MNILFITRKYPPSKGGMQLLAYELSEELAKRSNLRLVKWGGSNKALPLVLPWLTLQAIWQLLTKQIDIIHIEDGLLSPIGLLLAKTFRKPWAVVIHGLDITYDNQLFQMIVPRCVSKANQVFCISNSAAEQALIRGVDSSKIEVITLAVHTDQQNLPDRTESRKMLGLPEDVPILLSVGRLVKRKGVSWFIESVLPDLVKRYPNVIYVVVGSGAHEDSVRAAIKKTSTEKNVKLLGRVDNPSRLAAYRAADIFVMPNIAVAGDMEGFGLVLLEASMFELPTVASGIEGINDAVEDGNNGVLVASGDTQAYLRSIIGWINNPDEAKEFGRRSRKYTQAHYSWDVLAPKYIQAYQKILAPKK